MRLRAASELLAELVGLLESSGRVGEANRVSVRCLANLRKIVRQDPSTLPSLARFQLRRGDFVAALRTIDEAWKAADPEATARVTADLLRSGGATEQQRKTILGQLDAAVSENPDRKGLTILQAESCLVAGDFQRAESLFRKVVARNPDLALPRNELALLILFRGGSASGALRFVEQAIESAGPLPFLLDTRACVHLALNEVDRAIADLERAIEEQPSPAKYFHLTQAYIAKGNTGEALLAYRRAVDLKLHMGALHPLERDAYIEVTRQLLGRAGSPK